PLAQQNAANRPRLIANAINGKPAIEFDGNDILQSSSQISLGSFTVFTVFNSTNTSLGIVYEHSASTNANEGSFLSTSINSTVAVRRGSQTAILNHTPNWAHDGQYRIVVHTFRIGTPRLSLRINGVDLGIPVQGGANATTATQTLNIGARVGPTLGLQGRVAEIIFHNGELLPAQIDSVEAALSAKYNIPILPIAVSTGATNLTATSATLNATLNPRASVITYAKMAYGTNLNNLTDSINVLPNVIGQSGTSPIAVSATVGIPGGVYRLVVKTSSGATVQSALTVFPTIPLQDLIYWIRADAGVDTTASGRVTSCANFAFSINSAVQSNADNRPRYITNAINGRPALEFDGNDLLVTSNLAIGQYTVFSVFKSSSLSTALIYEHGTNTSSNEGFYLTNSSGNTVRTIRNGSGTSPSAGDYVANWASDNAFKVVTHQWRFSQPQHLLRANGVELPLSRVGLAANTSITQPLHIGARANASLGLNGQIAELIIYNRALASPQRDSVEEYLFQKYNIRRASGYGSAYITGSGIQLFYQTGLTIEFSGVNTSMGGNCTVQRFDNSPAQNLLFSGTPPTFTSPYRYVITNTGFTFTSALLRFDRTEIPNSGIANASTVRVYRRPNVGSGTFAILPNAFNPTFPNEVWATTTAFSEFILGSDDNQLPVELTNFGFRKVDAGIELRWTTTSELNNAGFEVERKSQGATWNTLGFVRGNGTTTEAQSYSFLDRTASGKVQYRLKQLDFDGQFEYSPVIEVDAGLPKQFALEQNYPNPFNPTTIINYQLPTASNVSLKIYDVLGKEVVTLVNGRQEAGTYNFNFNASNLASGVYFYRLQASATNGASGSNFVQTKKMMLVK
ncbi:MAG: T9SS type A sorting domain-containing protein, partial [Chloroherpetonaceae bacterium]